MILVRPHQLGQFVGADQSNAGWI